MKKISILGSTGSIGTQTLDIVRANKNDLQVVALAANTNIELLEKQIREFNPKLVCVCNEEKAIQLKDNIKDTGTVVVTKMEGLIETAIIPEADIVLIAVVGMIGVRPTIEAIKAHKDIALANKETLVTAGHIIMPLAEQMGINIIPVDSEHSAIFQSLQGHVPQISIGGSVNKNQIDKILLTASGGPFRGKTKSEMKNVQVEDALKHPNWSMGRKITIDSATMVNKGLEVIEAKWLFNVELDQIQVLVQPQSLIHSMVQYKDGGIIAQLGTPDMRLPIQYALFYPERKYLAGDRVDFGKLAQITFENPDIENFRGLDLAYKSANAGGSMPTVYNAANELAVDKFLHKKIKFLEITEIIEYCMDNHKVVDNPTVGQILDIEKATYEMIEDRW